MKTNNTTSKEPPVVYLDPKTKKITRIETPYTRNLERVLRSVLSTVKNT